MDPTGPEPVRLETLVVENITDQTIYNLWKNPSDVRSMIHVFSGLRHAMFTIRRVELADPRILTAWGRFLWEMFRIAESLDSLRVVGTDDDRPPRGLLKQTKAWATSIMEWRALALPFGQLIKDCIKDGLIVPMEVTVQLLENAMQATIDAAGPSATEHRFLIDGFPRKMDQAVKFEDAVCPAKLVLFYDCPEATMEARLLERGKTSGRADDNAESIRKRFRTFVETSMPVVDYFAQEGRVIKIDATSTPEDVYEVTKTQLKARLSNF
ncbi:Uridylate kinase like protein [Verticillium longisporum]|nr:Uridylate kinase like protein [Verticillium longisporum]